MKYRKIDLRIVLAFFSFLCFFVLTGIVHASNFPIQNLVHKDYYIDVNSILKEKSKNSILFIDSAVEDYKTILSSVELGTEKIVLDARRDGVTQMAEILSQRQNLSSVSIVSHGAPGSVYLGTGVLSLEKINAYENQLKSIAQSIRKDGSILFYGCDVAQGFYGNRFIRAIAAVTHKNVAASTNATGAASLGGDWVLESKIGIIDSSPVISPDVDYQKLLSAAQVFTLSGGAVYVRPGGTSHTWTYGNGANPVNLSTYAQITEVAYYNVNFTPPWLLTRGKYQYSTNSGSSWVDYPYPIGFSTVTFVNVTGTIWRFVDSLPGDTTTTNSVGNAWKTGGANSAGSGSTVYPDNPPTNIVPGRSYVLTDASQGAAVTTLTPTDTGYTTGGYWAIDSQSVPNLFAITFNASTSNVATLTLSTGVLPAIGQSATVNVRYYDFYQTDTSGNPINGQGYSKQLTFNVVNGQSNDLNFGGDIKVNTFTTNDQKNPATATLSNGNFVVVWQSSGQGGENSSKNGIYGKIYNSSGSAVGSEFSITSAGNGIDEVTPVVAALDNGRFVVAYGTTPGANGLDIAYRIVAADGTVGSELIANTTVSGDQNSPTITTLTDGSFVIAWTSTVGTIKAQKFNASNGSKNGAEISISSSATDVAPSISALSNGEYAVVWGDSATYDAKAVVSSAISTIISVTSNALVYSNVLGIPAPRVIGLTGGDFIVAWGGYPDANYDRTDILFQRYNNAGAVQGSVTLANNSSAINQYRDKPGLAALSGGGFVVGWQSDNGDYDLNGIFGRRFSSTGVAVDSTDFEVNEFRSGDQNSPVMTALASDVFATAWTDNTGDGTSASIEARVLLLPGYHVTYSGNASTGGSVPTDASGYLNGATVTVLGNSGSLVKTGYTFNGWNTAANGSGSARAPAATFAMGSANVTLYAQWTSLPTYSVTYDGNTSTGGSVPTDAGTYLNGATVTVLGNTGTLVKTGYSFSGWNTVADGSGTARAPAATFAMGGANVTLYAQWTALPTYSVTYDGNTSTGGSVPTDAGAYLNGATVTVLGNTGTLVKAGFSFSGWNTVADGSGTARAPAATFAMGGANVTLYAQWTALPTYSVTYSGNASTGGSVPTDAGAYLNGATVTVLGNSGSLVKTGYTFNGWNTVADGSGTARAPASTFVMGGANVTLYAQWLLQVNGACGSASGVFSAFKPSSNLCLAGSASAVSGGAAWGWSCTGSNGGTTASCAAATQSTSTGTGSGTAAVAATNGWVVDTANSAGFIPVTGNAKSPPAGTAPPGFSFPHGLFDFTLKTGTAGSAAVITITYPNPLPAGTVYWKYGPKPAPGNTTPHWYRLPPSQVAIAGNTITLTITDGLIGDSDITANSVIVDPGGPGVPDPTAGVTSVPTLSEWALYILAGLMAMFGMGQLQRTRYRG